MVSKSVFGMLFSSFAIASRTSSVAFPRLSGGAANAQLKGVSPVSRTVSARDRVITRFVATRHAHSAATRIATKGRAKATEKYRFRRIHAPRAAFVISYTKGAAMFDLDQIHSLLRKLSSEENVFRARLLAREISWIVQSNAVENIDTESVIDRQPQRPSEAHP